MSSVLNKDQADAIVALTKAVGEQVRRLLKEPLVIYEKKDGSSVTSIDLLAHRMVCEGFDYEGVHYKGLNAIAPGIHILSEEDETNHLSFKRDEPFFTLDPIDGTSKLIRYVKGNEKHPDGDKSATGFSIMVGLVENGTPTFGAVHYPAMGEHGTSYFTNARCNQLFEQVGEGENVQQSATRSLPKAGTRKAIILGNAPKDMMLGHHTFVAQPYSELDRVLRLAKGEAHVAYNNYTDHPPGYWDIVPFHAFAKAASIELAAFDNDQRITQAPNNVWDAKPMRYDDSCDAGYIKPGPYLCKSVFACENTLANLGAEAFGGFGRPSSHAARVQLRGGASAAQNPVAGQATTYENDPLIKDIVGKHGMTAEIAANFLEMKVSSLVRIGDKLCAEKAGIDIPSAELLLDALHSAYSGNPSRRRGGRDGSGMMF